LEKGGFKGKRPIFRLRYQLKKHRISTEEIFGFLIRGSLIEDNGVRTSGLSCYPVRKMIPACPGCTVIRGSLNTLNSSPLRERTGESEKHDHA
jgi:hypothetical protein